MRLERVRELVRRIAERQVRVPILLVGPMGVGKSWVVKEAARTLGIECIDLRLAQHEPGDLIGLPRMDSGKTIWARPSWWPEPDTRGILFLDELNRAPQDVRQAVFQLVTEWRLHTHELPPGWVIVSAINPDSGDYQVESLDIAMLRRFCQIKVVAIAADWIRWARTYGIHSGIIEFVTTHPDMLARKEEFRIEALPTPEGFRLVDAMLKAGVMERGTSQEIVAGLVGDVAGTALRRHLDKGEAKYVRGAAVLADYAAVAAELASQAGDRMLSTLHDVAAECAGTTLPAPALANLTAFLKALREEYFVAMVELIQDDPELSETLVRDVDLRRRMAGVKGQTRPEGKRRK
ncbi:MAG: AAA family ATPase [Deltaproteobacteria bacterium]|nr:AAA family ATPase [Deltaproteobacteria bacterium]